MPVTPGSRGAQDTEVEWQLDAIDLRPVERWMAARSGAGEVRFVAKQAKRLVDRYVDTDDWRIGRSGHVLRLRKRGSCAEATMKDMAPASGGLRRRLEVSEHVYGEGVESLGHLDPAGPVGRRVRAIFGGRPFVEILEVRTHRRPFEVRIGDATAGELALDDTTIATPGERRRLRLQRVELEVSPEHVARLQPLVDELGRDCGLTPASLSKFEAGLLAAGLAVPAMPDLGPTNVSPASTTGEVAFAALRRDTVAMLAHEPGTRLGEDIEELHQMRVSTRRLRAALDLFSDALPARAAHFRAELGWLAAALGAVRDLDIQLTHVDAWIAEAAEAGEAERDHLAELRGILDGHREAARGELLAALDSRRYDRLVAGFTAMLRAGPLRRSVVARQPAVVAMVPRVADRQRSAVKAARRARRSGIAADYHRLRIRCKRLRYSLEFSNGVYGEQLRRYAKRLATLQDELGLMQDAEVAAARLRSLVLSEDGERLSRDAIFVIGGLAERYRTECELRLRALPPHLRALEGSESTKAFASMRRQKAAVEDAARAAGTARPSLAVVPVRRPPAAAGLGARLADHPSAPAPQSEHPSSASAGPVSSAPAPNPLRPVADPVADPVAEAVAEAVAVPVGTGRDEPSEQQPAG